MPSSGGSHAEYSEQDAGERDLQLSEHVPWLPAQESHSGSSPASPAAAKQLRLNESPPFREGSSFPTIHATPTLWQPLQKSVFLQGNVLSGRVRILHQTQPSPARRPTSRLADVCLSHLLTP